MVNFFLKVVDLPPEFVVPFLTRMMSGNDMNERLRKGNR